MKILSSRRGALLRAFAGFAGDLDLILSDFAVKSRPVNAEDRRGLLFITLGAFERLFDDQFFYFLQSHVWRNVERIRHGVLGYVAEGQVFGLYARAFRQKHRALDGVLQFAHVARPAVRKHTLIGGLRKALQRTVVLLLELLEEVVGEQLQIFGALAQRRDVDGDRRDPVEEVFAHHAFLDRFSGLAVGGADQAEIGFECFGRTDGAEPPLFKHAQQFRLQLHGHFADLVEHQAAALRLGDQPLSVLNGAGERAFDVAEQLGFDQLFRQGGAVDLDELFFRAQRIEMEGVGDQLLTGARFADDQHVGVALGDAFDSLVDHLHRLRRADDARIFAPLYVAAEALRFADEPTPLQGLVGEQQNLISFERLFDEIIGAGLGGLDGFGIGPVAGDDDHLGVGRALFDGAQQRQPPLAVVWKLQVGQHQVEKTPRSEEHTSELQSLRHLVCRLLLEKKKKKKK